MTIHVQTPDHGVQKFDADTWDSDHDGMGTLWLGKDEDGVAMFARGAWLFVWETNDEAPADPREPRVWQSPADIPEGVTARGQLVPSVYLSGDLTFIWIKRDSSGLFNKWDYESHWFGPTEAIKADRHAPFTEVLDAK